MRIALPIVLLFISAALAIQALPDEQQTRDAIAKLGGKSEIDIKLTPEAPILAKFEKVNDAILVGLKKLPQIGAIDIYDATGCTDRGFASLKELPHLRKLIIGKAELSPAAVTAIGQCVQLRHLALLSCGINDAELVGLKKLTHLEHLSLSDNPGITDKGMLTVKGFERLRVLYLAKTSIGDKGLAELKPLDGLRTLNVKATKVTGDAADKFADEMPNLRKVAW